MKSRLVFFLAIYMSLPAFSQVTNEDLQKQLQSVLFQFETLSHRMDQMEKAIDDLMWFDKLEDIAIIDKVYMYGPPLAHEPNPTAQGYGNPVKFWSYIFMPQNLDEKRNTL